MEKLKLLSQRLNWAIEKKKQRDGVKKIANAAIAKAAGISPTSVGYWFNDLNGMDAENARKVGEFLDVDPVWLETGDGEPDAANAVNEPHPQGISLDALEIARAYQYIVDEEQKEAVIALLKAFDVLYTVPIVTDVSGDKHITEELHAKRQRNQHHRLQEQIIDTNTRKAAR